MEPHPCREAFVARDLDRLLSLAADDVNSPSKANEAVPAYVGTFEEDSPDLVGRARFEWVTPVDQRRQAPPGRHDDWQFWHALDGMRRPGSRTAPQAISVAPQASAGCIVAATRALNALTEGGQK